MDATNAVFDVDEEGFERDVLARSESSPVVVDFWAPWCGPCQFLGPVLERLIEGEFRDRMVLAKVNTDENPGLSVRFGIRGIPAVKIFRGREVVAEFVGALPEDEVRLRLREALPSETDLIVREGVEAEEAGDPPGAEAKYRAALEREHRHPVALFNLGRILEDRGDLGGALALYEQVPPFTLPEKEASHRIAVLKLRLEAGAGPTEEELRGRIGRDPKDIEARHDLGILLAAAGKHREALEQLLEVVKLDRRFRDDGGRKTMLQVFEVIGLRSELAEEFRAKLASVLF